MFVCAREASSPPGDTPQQDDGVGASPARLLPASRLPGASGAPGTAASSFHLHSQRQQDATAYLQRVQAAQRTLARILDVHTLSSALQFAPDQAIGVDGAAWWRELQRQSVANVHRQAQPRRTSAPANDNTENGTVAAMRGLWTRSTRRWQPEQQQSRPVRSVRPRCRSVSADEDEFADVSACEAGALFAEALLLLLRALDRINSSASRDIDALAIGLESWRHLAPKVDAAIALASARLLRRWLVTPVVPAPASDSEPTASALTGTPPMGVAVVNALLQTRRVGSYHAFHGHRLLPSVPRRAFPGSKRWNCSVCSRGTSTVSSDGAASPCVHRCAACDFNLCRECFTRVPNWPVPREPFLITAAALEGLDSTRFLALAVSGLEASTQGAEERAPSNEIVCALAVELRRRTLELYPQDFQAAVTHVQLFQELLASSSMAAKALVQSTSSSASPASAGLRGAGWFPPFTRTWTMSLNTLLGPFLRASTMTKETQELESAVRAARHGAATESLRGQWASGYDKLRETLQTLASTLLGDDQQLVVVDAMLCWLAVTLLTADQRRRMNFDVHERLDGFLVNVTTLLLAQTLPVLQEAQFDTSRLDAGYHQTVEPVRVYASKDFPEVPLHYARHGQEGEALREGEQRRVDAEVAMIRSRDERSIAAYDQRRGCGVSGKQETSEAYYPRLSCHEGVVCDRCEFPNFHGVRYKCAFCADMDLCSACFEDFRAQQASAASSACVSDTQSVESESLAHNLDHVFLRIETPIPVFAVKHFKPLSPALLTAKSSSSGTDEATHFSLDGSSEGTTCADCGDVLGATGSLDEVVHKCANCFSPRYLCVACLTREEALSNGDPHQMHAPGHIYFVVTGPWRCQVQTPTDELVRKLHFPRLLHPPALVPRLRFARDTEVFYMTLKYLHFGPLHTLSRWLSVAKELQELQAFCACDEERFEMERERRERQGRRRPSSSRRRELKRSAHYKASKTRLEDLRVKRAKMELHLLASSNVVEWLVFYARTSRWLLGMASPSDSSSQDASTLQDPFAEPLTTLSPALSRFPEHFFFDLCDVMHLLSLEKLSYQDLVTELQRLRPVDNREEVDEVTEVVEPLLVMLTQLVVATKFTKNPHLRVEALRSLSALLTFVSKGQHMHQRLGHRRMDALFSRHRLLSRWLVPGVLQFHHDMDRYNASNNGLAFTSAVSSGDHMLWGFLPTRLGVTMLLRYLWQLPSQRRSLLHALSSLDARTLSTSSLTSNNGAQQLTGLVSGLWSDIAKLFDETQNKTAALRQMHELLEASLDGNAVVLPFRRDMLDGYVAIHAKQLRLTLRLLLEALELASWLAAMASGVGSNSSRPCSRSLSAPAAALRHVLMQPLVVEQAARTLSFLVASLANTHEEKHWAFSPPLAQDGKLLLAHLIVLVVRYAGRSVAASSAVGSSSYCSPSSFWKVVRASGDSMERRVGDLDTHERWGLNTLCTRIESEQYLGSSVFEDRESSGQDEDEDEDELRVAEHAAEEEGRELDENEVLALLEKQAASSTSNSDSSADPDDSLTVGATVTATAVRRRLGKRFIATLAKDGRFDRQRFVRGCRFLRIQDGTELDEQPVDASDERDEGEGGYMYLDDTWVQQFVGVMKEADKMIQVQAAMEACLGEVPEQYLDPLLSTLMTDPVRLPSGNILDRAVIARHLLASSQQGGATGVDPFTREPLTMEMVVPCDALRSEIQLYLRSKMRHFRKTAREDVLATWGLGWDYLFEGHSEADDSRTDGEVRAEGEVDEAGRSTDVGTATRAQ